MPVLLYFANPFPCQVVELANIADNFVKVNVVGRPVREVLLLALLALDCNRRRPHPRARRCSQRCRGGVRGGSSGSGASPAIIQHVIFFLVIADPDHPIISLRA